MDIELDCLNCKNKFFRSRGEINKRKKKGYKMFCSKNCASEHRRNTNRTTLNCYMCGIEFDRINCNVNKERNFCSHTCSNKYIGEFFKGKKKRTYVNGEFIYRKLAFENNPHSCALCDFSEQYALEVHHIDKNRKNNDLSNLIVVCANCHRGIHKKALSILSKLKDYLHKDKL